MKKIEPKVYLIGYTELLVKNLNEYLYYIGNPAWKPDFNITSGENLAEFAGRLCYRSWEPYDENKPDCTNPNVSKIREGNKEYIKNILESKHGSILEHVNLSFLCKDVSRVFTHELVRHRAGVGYSQESLRYVRLNELKFWYPPEVENNEKLKDKFDKSIKLLEEIQNELQNITNINSNKSFHSKKQLTSMFRRLAPLGLATTILFTANVRAMRHMIEQRTSPGAEVEIRYVFNEIAKICKETYPNLFQDMYLDGESWKFENSKV